MLNNQPPRMLFLQMPWATTQRPSIALAILTRLCEEASVPVRTFYPNLDMSATVGFEIAGRFANERALYGLSEHLFAADLFGKDALQSEAYLDAFSQIVQESEDASAWTTRFADVNYLKCLRDEVVPGFLDAVQQRVLAESPTVVGFTATFNQVMSSLALARRLKQVRPDIQIIVGGACFDGEMGPEYHRATPGILDHVFIGEAEESFRDYLRRLKAGESTDGIPCVTYYEDGELRLIPGHPLMDLNQSPSPNYDDFFAETDRLRQETGKIFNIERLPFESSRGCWWGRKNHCVFCGINEDLMGFRAKDIDRVMKEIITLSARYGVVKLTATDWIISRWHCDELFRRLKELDLDIEIFYEVRADMKKGQIKAMKEAGVVQVQPGIESLSTPLLKLMRKGTTAIRHVQFLRWCREVGVGVAYNILGGFPDEKAEWYLEMAKLIPRLRHIQPPLHNLTYIEMHRFAPLFEQRERFGVDMQALRADYQFNFPDGIVDPLKIGYFFQFHCTRTVPESEYVSVVRAAIEPWIAAHKEMTPPIYEYRIGAGFLEITDTREGGGRYLHLEDLYHDVVLVCDEIQTRRSLARDLSARYPKKVADGTLDRVIDELIAADVLMVEGIYLLTLPIGHRARTTEQLRAYVLGEELARQNPSGQELTHQDVHVVAAA
ncbi:MAG: RiPP maturation radical SAM protein 1 [Acidobacteria bacterium]|nr:RiPP maturation radical SAM protein 1 [Acidobacteriota bacterium]